jgi:hypothetical protein
LELIHSSEDIRASLTTSKFSLYSIDVGFNHTAFVKMNLPICVAESHLISLYNEKIEHDASIMAKEMVKEIFVDSSKKYFFIGEDHNNEMTALICYSVEHNGLYEQEFFKRWDEIRSLLFEFQVFGKNGEDIFVIKGLWLKDKWHFLDVFPSSKLHIAKDIKIDQQRLEI